MSGSDMDRVIARRIIERVKTLDKEAEDGKDVDLEDYITLSHMARDLAERVLEMDGHW